MTVKNHPGKPMVLCILDGWGYRQDADDNAISKANTPFWDSLIKEYPNSLLKTSGLAVGLPEGQMGNSEVGHMNIGGGRVVMQNLPKIDASIKDGSLKSNPNIQKLIDTLKKTGQSCHITGLISPGGVHSHMDHVVFLAKTVAEEGVEVKVHAFLDGRDTPPSGALEYIEQFEKDTADYKNISIATVSGRYYAMDRDNRWDRVQKAYDAMVLANGEQADSALEAIKRAYENDQSDEFVQPVVIGDYQGMEDSDALIMANFRSDRVRQILAALLDPAFEGFERKSVIEFSHAVGMVEYSKDLNTFLEVISPPEKLEKILGEVVADHGLKQLRIAETEKYAHVTFFFNGGREKEFEGEERILVPSADVATYDLKPEMSAGEVTDQLVDAIESDRFDLIVVNYANTDMVGHTGDQNAVIKAVEAVDGCLDNLVSAVLKADGAILITADHGNAEQMLDEQTGEVHTAHTSGPVPFVIATNNVSNIQLKDGSLCDIAPTILDLIGVDQPEQMTGESLIA